MCIMDRGGQVPDQDSQSLTCASSTSTPALNPADLASFRVFLGKRSEINLVGKGAACYEADLTSKTNYK